MKKWGLLVGAVVLGVVNALVYLGFKVVVNDGQNLLWNEWLDTDNKRWLVVPVAVVFSLAFSLILRWLENPRWLKPETGLHILPPGGKTELSKAGSTLAIGASGLLAGASLGPEMPLMETSQELGKWLCGKLRLTTEQASMLVSASIGALLVAFLGSMLMVILPLMLIYRKSKSLPVMAVLIILLAGLTSFATLHVTHHVSSYGNIPADPPVAFTDYAGAAAVALVISFAALFMIRLMGHIGDFTKDMDKKLPWYVSAGLFGLALGVLYLLGGQPIQFSGSAGIGMLVRGQASYGAWAFFGFALLKILATTWSKASGYRGGLYFPSIFMGVAIAFWLGAIFDPLQGPGAMLGAIAAIFMALSIPNKPSPERLDYISAAVGALIFMAALVPIALVPLVLVSAITAAFGHKTLLKAFPQR